MCSRHTQRKLLKNKTKRKRHPCNSVIKCLKLKRTLPTMRNFMHKKRNIQYDQCDFVAADVKDMVNHILQAHNQFPCIYCEYTSKCKDTLISHMAENHENHEQLNMISGQLAQMYEIFEYLRISKMNLRVH